MDDKNRMRYDPLYRVIDETENMRIIEGNLLPVFERLKRITNLGIIPEIIEMANHSKYEHYAGTMHQIVNLIEYGDIKEDYRIPLEISGILLHLGHLPFTYSTERSLLLACNLDSKVKSFVEKKIFKVLKAAEFEKKEQEKHFNDLILLKNYKNLYKYFSAKLFIDKYGKLQDICELEDDYKSIIIRNLIDDRNEGYKLLNFTDTVDYVQRDALYFGSVRIDISPKHLYRNLKQQNTYSIDEKKLINSNRDYLKERFYQNTEIKWFTRLFEKILAMLLINKKFKKDWLFNLDDDQFRKIITEDIKENKSVGLPYNWINRMKSLLDHDINFSLTFEITNVPFKINSAIDLEYKILAKRKSITGLLKYPFEEGILLDIDYDKNTFPRPGFQEFTIILYQNNSLIKFISILKVIKRLRNSCSLQNIGEIEGGVCKQFSWNNQVRFNTNPVFDAMTEIVEKIENDLFKEDKSIVYELTRDLRNKDLFKKIIQENNENYRYWTYMKLFLDDLPNRKQGYRILLSFIFGFPEFIKYKKVKNFIDLISITILEKFSEISKDKRGHFFEALWLLLRLLDKKEFKILINGMIVSNPDKTKDKMDENEFDIIEIYIEDDQARCDIYACSIADDYEKNEDQLRKLAKNIYDKYHDVSIKAYYVVPKNKKNNEWEPVVKPTGISWP